MSIVAASARARAEHGRALTLSHIVEEAGVGRNTFYEHFADVESALRAAEAERNVAVERALEEAVKTARTPIERLRGIARAWIAALSQRPDAADVPSAAAFGLDDASLALESSLRGALAEARAVGAIGRAIEAVRLRCVVGAFEAAARLSAQGSASSVEIEDALVDLTLRAFR